MHNQKLPLISVIIPIYNGEKFIERCVDSVLNQTYQNIEVILVNDGSKDRSKEICDSLAEIDSRIKVINKQNGGVSSARNVGIQNSVGKWLCFIDVDDYIEDNYLDLFNVQTTVDIDLYAQGYKIIDTNNKCILRSPNKVGVFDKSEAFSILETSDILNSPVFKLYKRAIIEDYNISFDKNISYGEDHIFSMEYLFYVRKTAIRLGNGYFYVRQESSLTNRNLDIKRLLYYMLAYSNKYIDLFRPSKKYLFHTSYNLRQYSNIKRLFKEALYQKAIFFYSHNERKLIAKKISFKGLNIHQKVLMGVFKYLSYII